MEEYGHDEQGRPRIVLPEVGTPYRKFVQLCVNEIDYFMSDNQINRDHKIILEEVLNQQFGISSQISQGFPLLEGANYICIGAGDISVYHDLIDIGGESLGYKKELGIILKPNKPHLIKLLPLFPEDKMIALNGKPLERK